MKIFTRRLLFSFAITILSVFSLVSPAYASQFPHNPLPSFQGRAANLTVEPLKPLALGDHPVVTVHLTAQFGQPIANQPIIIFMDRHRKAAGKTDSRGIAVIPLKYKFPAGTYQLEVVYPGIPKIGLPYTSTKADMIVE